MRFSFDELYADVLTQKDALVFGRELLPEGDDSDIEYSFIGDISDGLQLKLPKKSSKEKVVSTTLTKTNENAAFIDFYDAKLAAMVDSLDILMDTSHQPWFRQYRKQTANNHETAKKLDESNEVLIEDECENQTYLNEDMLNSVWDDHVSSLEKDNEQLIAQLKRERLEEEHRRQRALKEERRKAQEEEERKNAEEKRTLEEQERARKAEEVRLRKELDAKKEADERKKQELRAKEEEEAKIAKESASLKDIHTTFSKYKHMIQEIKVEIVEPVKKDTNLKKLLAQHKRKINPKFGQLTNSMSQLESIFNELSVLIEQTRPNQLGYKWILNFISKAVVSQAESEVAVKPESALPLGKLCLSLLVKYPELKELLLARFVKKCPLVIGYTCSIDTEEGRKRMGWRRRSDGKWEEDTSYDERMGGIMTLFAVITRLSLPQEIIKSTTHPLPISHSWKIVARIANTPLSLLNNSHFVVLAAWWEAAAAQFLLAYGRQAQKLLDLISNDLTSTVADRKLVGAARLRILYEDWKTTHSIAQFPEMSV